MDEKLAKQLEQVMEKTEREGLGQTMRFFQQVKSLEDLTREDLAFVTEQMNVHKEAVLTWAGKEEAARILPFIFFEIGRAYERYYSGAKRD